MHTISRRHFLSASAAAGLVWSTTTRALAQQSGGASDNPYLQDNFAPVHEEVAADNLKVIGQLPADLDGMFVRNGPNPQFPPQQNYHLFEGDGMLHGVRVRDGQASYRNRWVRTAVWREEHKAGRALYPSFLDPIDFQKLTAQILAGKPPFPNRANTALVWHHSQLLALWEGGSPHEIQLPDLDTVGEYHFGGQLRHAFTAHPKIDPHTGHLVFLGYSPLPPFVQYSVADRSGAIVHTTPIELPRPVMMHDLAITQHHTLLFDMPGVLNLVGALGGESIFKWAPEFGARIGVLPRMGQGQEIKWFEVDPCFVFHVFNAFEDGDGLHVYACRFPKYPGFVNLNAPVSKKQLADQDESEAPIAYGWHLDLRAGTVHEGPVDELACEFPRVDDLLAGRPYRYGYAVAGLSGSNALVKFDFGSGARTLHACGPGRLAGEGVFVRKRNHRDEDDGYLVSFVHDQVEQQSEMIVADCRDFSSRPMARVLLPRRVPFGFHGLWLDGEVL